MQYYALRDPFAANVSTAKQEGRALVGYALGFGCMDELMAGLLSAQQHRYPLLVYGWVTLAL